MPQDCGPPRFRLVVVVADPQAWASTRSTTTWLQPLSFCPVRSKLLAMQDPGLGERGECSLIIDEPCGRTHVSGLTQGSRAAHPRETSSEVQPCGSL